MLDIMLGSHHSCIGVGELSHFTHVRKMSRTCSCGELVSDCEFWSKVYNLWLKAVGKQSIEHYQDHQRSFEKLRSMPRLVRTKRSKRADFSRYAHITKALYQAIDEVAGARIIVDSSKNPARAYALDCIRGVKVFPIHLVRDSRAVVWSYIKRRHPAETIGTLQLLLSPTLWRTILDWNLQNELTRRLINKFERSLVIRYEDLVRQPDRELEVGGKMIGIDMDEVVSNICNDEEILTGHLVAGNKTRKNTAIRLEPDFSWRKKMPRPAQRISYLCTAIIARRYGYHAS